MNLPTILVGLAVAALVVAVIVSEVKNRRKGSCGCGYGCAGCANAGICHPEKKETK